VWRAARSLGAQRAAAPAVRALRPRQPRAGRPRSQPRPGDRRAPRRRLLLHLPALPSRAGVPRPITSSARRVPACAARPGAASPPLIAGRSICSRLAAASGAGAAPGRVPRAVTTGLSRGVLGQARAAPRRGMRSSSAGAARGRRLARQAMYGGRESDIVARTSGAGTFQAHGPASARATPAAAPAAGAGPRRAAPARQGAHRCPGGHDGGAWPSRRPSCCLFARWDHR